IGRTARAGASGVALSFCTAEERGLLADIEGLIRMRLPVADHRHRSPFAAPVPTQLDLQASLPLQKPTSGRRHGLSRTGLPAPRAPAPARRTAQPEARSLDRDDGLAAAYRKAGHARPCSRETGSR